jgi:DNA polymerase III delta prime subunit
MAETFAALPIMLSNEILRAFKLPFDEADENLSKIYVKQGYEAIDYLSSGIDDIPPIDE